MGEMIHADADAAFKMLDVDNEGSIDNEKLRKYLYTRDYSPELVDKVFAGIDVDKGGDIDADALRTAFEVKSRSVWAAMDDGTSEADIFAIADKVFALVDTDNSGDIEVAELKALLLADDWEETL